MPAWHPSDYDCTWSHDIKSIKTHCGTFFARLDQTSCFGCRTRMGIDVVHHTLFTYSVQKTSSSFSSRLMHSRFCSIFFTRAQSVKRRTLLGCHENSNTQTCCTFADLDRGASRPGSISMIVFLNFSIVCASFGSTLCSF